MNKNIIAIDGPAGSGKSTVAREVAKQIGFQYFDSGAYYRVVTLHCMNVKDRQGSTEDFFSWLQKQNYRELLAGVALDCEFRENGENDIFLNKDNVSAAIRTPEVTEQIKHIANKAEFREFVNKYIRDLASRKKLVMDGRDLGTEVFPDAVYKFFLTASIGVRALRRQQDLAQRGISEDLKKLEKDIELRDKTDMERDIAPLKQAGDAILIDTSLMGKNIVIETVLSGIKKENL